MKKDAECLKQNLKILLVGDASNCHNSLATGLRRLGHNVTVASAGSQWMQTARDIDLSRSSGRMSGAWLWTRLNMIRHRCFTGYDIVALASPNFLDLKPHRILDFYRFLRRHNRAVFLTALGTDIPYIDLCTAPDTPLRYSEWQIDGKPSPLLLADPGAADRWHSPALQRLHNAVYSDIDGAVSVLYEYDLSIRRVLPTCKTAYGGIPIDTDSIAPVSIPDNPGCVRFLAGVQRGRELIKGTDRLIAAAKAIVDRYPGRASLDIVENLPYADYVKRMRQSHVVLDQLYSYTPATNALLAMAAGLVTFSGNEPDFYRFIGENKLRPVIGCAPDDRLIHDTLERLVLNPSEIAALGRQGREFVKRHNDCTVVAHRFVNFWKSRLFF